MRRTAAGKLALEYLDRFPDLPSKTIAEKLFHDHPQHFTNVDAARSRVRYYRGNMGKSQRSSLAVDTHRRPNSTDTSPFADLPDPIGGWEELKVRKIRCAKAGIISDLHIPFHDRKAVEIALSYLKDAGIDALIINGDLIDFYTVSRWEKNPTLTTLRQEWEMTCIFLRILRREFPGVQIVWKLGNHCERWDKYLQAKAPLLCDMPFLGFSKVFGLDELNIHISPRTERIEVGQISIVHGHEFWGSISGAVNAARGLYLKARANAICGHLHHSSQHSESNLEGKQVGTWSLGALCQMHPYYAPINKWNHGFAVIDNRADKLLSSVSNHQIIDGEVL